MDDPNPLVWPQNPLTQGGPTWADAWTYNSNAAQNWLQQQRQASYDQGLADPNTGLPTRQGLLAAAQQYGNALMMGTTSPGVTAYHGSPFDFERFDMSKIGTGEGNQGQGLGMYFSTDPASAELYRTMPHMPQRGFTEGPGHAYEVSLGVDPGKMMDYSKPFEEQSPFVQAAIADVAKTGGFEVKGRLYGVKDSFVQRLAGSPELAGQLRDKGVQGAQFDWFTPGKLTEKGELTPGSFSKGYTVFDDNLIKIIKKYGIAGLGIGLGAGNALDQSQ